MYTIFGSLDYYIQFFVQRKKKRGKETAFSNIVFVFCVIFSLIFRKEVINSLTQNLTYEPNKFPYKYFRQLILIGVDLCVKHSEQTTYK